MCEGAAEFHGSGLSGMRTGLAERLRGKTESVGVEAAEGLGIEPFLAIGDVCYAFHFQCRFHLVQGIGFRACSLGFGFLGEVIESSGRGFASTGSRLLLISKSSFTPEGRRR